MVKNLPAMQETWVQSLGQEDSLEKEPERRSSSSAPRRGSAEPRPRGCSGLGRASPSASQLLAFSPGKEHLFEGNPVGEGTTRRGTATPVHRPQRSAGATHSSTRGLRPPEQLDTGKE